MENGIKEEYQLADEAVIQAQLPGELFLKVCFSVKIAFFKNLKFSMLYPFNLHSIFPRIVFSQARCILGFRLLLQVSLIIIIHKIKGNYDYSLKKKFQTSL